MKRHMKKGAAVLTVLLFALVIAACGRDSAAGSASGEGGPIEVVFWHSFSGANGETLEAMIEEYNQTRGAEQNITVNLVFQGFEGTNNVILAYQTNDTSNAPDINVGLVSTIPNMLDLSWTVDVSEFLNNPSSSVTPATFPAAMQRMASVNGRMAAIPFANSIPLLFYNADALREAGFDRAPANFDELIEWTKALTQVDATGAVTRYGVNFPVMRYQMIVFTVNQNPNSFFFDNEGGRVAPVTRVTAGEDGTMAAFLTQLERLIATGGFKWVEDNPNQEFAQGLNAMVIRPSSHLGAVRGLVAGSFDFQTAFLPHVNAGDTGSAPLGGSCLSLFNRGDDARVRAAWDVVEFLLRPENSARFSMVSGFLPVNVEAMQLPEMVAFIEENPQFLVGVEQMLQGAPNSQEPFDIVFADVQRIITNTMLEFKNGNLTVEQVIERIVRDVNRELDDWHAANF
ncbi:MAG: extracellular solute-binding protein [Defluviitaleaceae bacterium]|nr:extracellular solute-binding protein [Defluviitaleaceae bacterium]